MNKLDLIDKIAGDLKMAKKDVSLVINSLTREIINDVNKGNKVIISNFGTFSKSEIASYDGFHPQTGEKIIVPPSIRIHFNSSKNWHKGEGR